MSQAYIVAFTHCGNSYNVWVWPNDTSADDPAAQVSYRAAGTRQRWAPIQIDDGTVAPVEVQT